MITVFLGAPGTGKGTVATILKEEYGYKHLSTGDIFRKIIASGSDLGKEVSEVMDKGNLINDEMTNKVLEQGLAEYNLKTDKLILDGYPRTIDQAIFLDNLLENQNIKLEDVFQFELSQDIILKRLSGRQTCPTDGKSYNTFFMPSPKGKYCEDGVTLLTTRPDDAPENVTTRLKAYDIQTAPLIGFYIEHGNRLKPINGNQEPKVMANEIDEILKK
jgi:adenylate kinase